MKSRKTHFWVSWIFGFFSAFLVLILGLVWLGGIVYLELPEHAVLGPDFSRADVIVCLTGGRGRIRKALEYFEKNYGGILYISGVDERVGLKELLRESDWKIPLDENRVILENVSRSTIENAQQVKKFLNARGYQKILLVTSAYHMRRAHYIFRKVLPSTIQIEAAWLEKEPFFYDEWWTSWNSFSVTLTEFLKFIIAYARLLT